MLLRPDKHEVVTFFKELIREQSELVGKWLHSYFYPEMMFCTRQTRDSF